MHDDAAFERFLAFDPIAERRDASSGSTGPHRALAAAVMIRAGHEFKAALPPRQACVPLRPTTLRRGMSVLI